MKRIDIFLDFIRRSKSKLKTFNPWDSAIAIVGALGKIAMKTGLKVLI